MNRPSIFLLRIFSAALACGTLTALPACAETSRPSGMPAATAVSKPPMRIAAPRKANGSGIEVQFRLAGTARPGEALSVTLGFVGVVPQSGASVRFEADAGLTLPDTYRTAVAIPDDASASPVVVNVTPTADGLAYLHVFTTQHGVTSVSSIPLQTGAPALAKSRNDLQSTPDGDLLRTMPVK